LIFLELNKTRVEREVPADHVGFAVDDLADACVAKLAREDPRCDKELRRPVQIFWQTTAGEVELGFERT
jgi:hypothetical protein